MRTNKIIYKIFSFCFITLLWTGCKEEGRLDHIDDSASAPQKITISEVINQPGGAVIKFNVPNDKNLAGVKAVYYRNDERVEAKASLYVDSVVIEGYGDTNTYDVDLYSIGRNEKLSEPVRTQITPLTPAVLSASKEIQSAFGGVGVSFSNHSNANLSLVLMVDTLDNGLWSPLQTFYTKADTGVFYRRGLPDKELKFGMYIRDRWNNKSDTIVRNLTPIPEERLPKNTFSNQKLPTDYWDRVQSDQYRIEGIWDDIYTSRVEHLYASPHDAPIPFHFTISLGYKAAINRFKIYHRRGGDEYSGASPRTFELWGSDNPPIDGSWDNWHLLGRFESFKPSGYQADGSVGAVTEEDRDYAANQGIDCELVPTDEILDPHKPVTHLRFKTLSTYNTHGTDDVNTGQTIIVELTFWGQKK